MTVVNSYREIYGKMHLPITKLMTVAQVVSAFYYIHTIIVLADEAEEFPRKIKANKAA